MQSARETWTDERLDDLSQRMEAGLQHLREEMQLLRAEANVGRSELNGRIDSFQRTMVICFVTLSTATIGGMATIATQV